MKDDGLLLLQVNVVSYKTRANAKDFIQVEIVVEKNSQKIILIGKVLTFTFVLSVRSIDPFFPLLQSSLFVSYSVNYLKMEVW